MKSENRSGQKTFPTGGSDIGAFVRVVIDSSGVVSAAGDDAAGIGVTTEAAAGPGWATVKLWSASGTWQIETAGAIAIGDALYAGANGTVAASGTVSVGLIAIEEATAAGDVIEVALAASGAGGGSGAGSVTVSSSAPSGTPSDANAIWIHKSGGGASWYFWNGTDWQLSIG